MIYSLGFSIFDITKNSDVLLSNPFNADNMITLFHLRFITNPYTINLTYTKCQNH
jgi:hypothetical protein